MLKNVHVDTYSSRRKTPSYLVILSRTLVLGLPAGTTLGSVVKVRVDLSPEGQRHQNVCATLADGDDDDPASRLAVEVSGETETHDRRVLHGHVPHGSVPHRRASHGCVMGVVAHTRVLVRG